MTRPPRNVFALGLALGLALLCGLGLGLVVSASPAAAADTPNAMAAVAATGNSPGRPAITVWVEPNGTRQKGGASALTEMHAKMALEGWNIADIEVYVEDGDMKGFFATYTR